LTARLQYFQYKVAFYDDQIDELLFLKQNNI
jgi:hypothetical protein